VRMPPLAYLMIMAKKPEKTNYKVLAENRRARYDFAIDDDLEVGANASYFVAAKSWHACGTQPNAKA